MSASGTTPPHTTRVQAVVEGGHLDHAIGQAAQRHRQRRDLGGPVVGVGDDDHVGGEVWFVGRQQPAQRRRTALLLPSTNTVTPTGPAAVGAERGQMGGDPGLVVGGAPAVEPAVPFGRFKRGRIPLRPIAFGLDVVVGIQQHGGAPGGAGVVGDDSRRPALADDLHAGEPGVA